MASGTGHMNLYPPYDQPAQDNEQMMDQNNLHLTHYKSKLNQIALMLLIYQFRVFQEYYKNNAVVLHFEAIKF